MCSPLGRATSGLRYSSFSPTRLHRVHFHLHTHLSLAQVPTTHKRTAGTLPNYQDALQNPNPLIATGGSTEATLVMCAAHAQ